MGNTAGAATWEDNVYLFEENDPVQGGADGIDNVPIKQLANRTAYLKQLCAQLAQTIPGTAEFEKIYREIAALNVTKVEGRVDHLERLTGNIMLALQAGNMSPDGYDGMMTETFDTAAEIDQTVTIVTSVVSGDDSIDVENANGIVIGAHYQLTDGEAMEEVQVKSLNIAGSINRVIFEDVVKNQYVAGRAKLYRSSVAIYNSKAYGGGNLKTDTWETAKTWSGSTTAQAVSAETVYKNDSDFIVTGATFENGVLVLGSAVVGIALVATGGGSGTWKQIDEWGDNV